MMIDIRVPSAGESITQVELARWLAKDGQYVEKDQEIAEIDSDKATLTINAEQAGILSISMEEGSSTEPGKVIGTIDTAAEKPAENAALTDTGAKQSIKDAASQLKTPNKSDNHAGEKTLPKAPEADKQQVTFSPQAKKTLEEAGIDAGTLTGHPENKRITKKDVLAALASGYKKDQPVDATARDQGQHQKNENTSPAYKNWGGDRQEDRQKMSTLRRKIAERLVAVKNQTAMLTTFNEVDMTALIKLRSAYQEAFTNKYGLKLGFMSFFARAVAESIPFFPGVNGYIDGDHIVYPGYADIGIAVSTPKGLMVPVIRSAESMRIDQLESKIQELAAKAREGKISLEELTGGTISITNGGIFGSMLSTPILNPPQSAILGMHNIIERPVAINGKVEIRPMMYLALSYDHRIIDGRESVGFLVKIKEMIEQPALMALHGKPAESLLLGL